MERQKRVGNHPNIQLFLFFHLINGSFAAWAAEPVTNFFGLTKHQRLID